MPVYIDGNPKSLANIVDVAKGREKVVVPHEAQGNMARSRQVVENTIAEGRSVYGVTTGFGKFADVPISKDAVRTLQKNLIMSHAAGTGEVFSPEEVRAAMFLRANALAKGMSGVRPVVVETLAAMLNERVTPVVPQKGSVGASGDLAPLAHVALTMIGIGQAYYGDEEVAIDAARAMAKAGIVVLELEAKEGLALTNGVQMTAGVLAMCLDLGQRLAKAADIIASLTGQALSVIPDAYDLGLIRLRPQHGVEDVARNLRTLLAGSELVTRPGQFRVQDPYTLRCIPQVHGAVRQAIHHVTQVLETESGSATDNPLILPDGRVISGGNFHGQPLGVAGDYLGLSLCSLGNISERRIARLMSGMDGVPLFLTPEGGLNSGLMILQYAAASLCSENKVLAHPASVDTIPTSADQEDHVSMCTIAARKARDIADNVATVLAIEYFAACQALYLRGNVGISSAGRAAYDLLWTVISPVTCDREMAPDVEAVRRLILSDILIDSVEKVTEALW